MPCTPMKTTFGSWAGGRLTVAASFFSTPLGHRPVTPGDSPGGTGSAPGGNSERPVGIGRLAPPPVGESPTGTGGSPVLPIFLTGSNLNPNGIPASSPRLRRRRYLGFKTIQLHNPTYVFSAMVRMARRAVPARVVAGGTNNRTTLPFEGAVPLHAARASQGDVTSALDTCTPTRVLSSFRRTRAGTQLLQSCDLCFTVTQRSSCLATQG